MDPQLELLDIERAADGRYLVTLRFVGRGRASGAQVDLLAGQVLTVRDGLLLRLDAYSDVADARAAVGREER